MLDVAGLEEVVVVLRDFATAPHKPSIALPPWRVPQGVEWQEVTGPRGCNANHGTRLRQIGRNPEPLTRSALLVGDGHVLIFTLMTVDGAAARFG